MLCRDETSYQIAQNEFPNVKTHLFPDIVTTQIGRQTWNSERKGILFCMRNDKEAFYSKTDIEKLRTKLEKSQPTAITDTTLDIPIREIRKNRTAILQNIWKEYSGYKLIITDRYHGTIFSLVANTPVIVLSSTDHKLESGVKWFPESFSSYVKFAKNLDEAYQFSEQILHTAYTHDLEPYFKKNYYDKLKTLLS